MGKNYNAVVILKSSTAHYIDIHSQMHEQF